jgi:hypothetical protein
VRYVRLRATSPTYGAVTLIIVHEPGVALYYLLCVETAISGPRLIRAWKRRYWIEYCFRTLKHLLATGACQVWVELRGSGQDGKIVRECVSKRERRHMVNWAKLRPILR